MNVQQLEQDFAAAREHALVMQSRNVDPETMQAALERARNAKDRLDRARTDANLQNAIDRLAAGGSSSHVGGLSLGASIVNSDMFKWIRETRGTRSQVWNSPVSEIAPLNLLATTVDESSGSGGKLVITDYQPGILELPTRRLVVADLFASGTTTSNTIGYMQETTFTNAAAPVAEGAAKPESTVVFNAVTDPVVKIAHWIPVTEEMFEDVTALRGYLDARLRTGVQLTEDDQLLNGSGTLPAMRGVLNRTGLAATVARGADTNADAIAKQIAAIETATNLAIDGIVMNPTNWLTISLAKDANGNYIGGGGPFAMPRAPILWGRPVSLTSAIAAGTALVGAFKTAGQIFRNGGMRVDASNSHNDFFVKNLVAVRAEQREALCIYRASAFGPVSGLN